MPILLYLSYLSLFLLTRQFDANLCHFHASQISLPAARDHKLHVCNYMPFLIDRAFSILRFFHPPFYKLTKYLHSRGDDILKRPFILALLFPFFPY